MKAAGPFSKNAHGQCHYVRGGRAPLAPCSLSLRKEAAKPPLLVLMRSTTPAVIATTTIIATAILIDDGGVEVVRVEWPVTEGGGVLHVTDTTSIDAASVISHRIVLQDLRGIQSIHPCVILICACHRRTRLLL